MSYTDLFGGNAVRPAQPSFLQLDMDEDLALVWPLESTDQEPSVAAMINVIPSTSGLSLAMPPGNQGSLGVQTMMTNRGGDDLTLTDTSGNAITTIATTESWLIALIDNTTTDGSWTALQMASTTSQASAAALAGVGLAALAGKLVPSMIVVSGVLGTRPLTLADRFHMIVDTGGGSLMQLASKATLGNGWMVFVKNDGATALTISTTGPDTIDGGGPISIQPGEGALIACSASAGFYTIRSIASPVAVASGGTGATNAPDALTNLGGTAIGQSIFTAPNAAAVRAILGISALTLTESTVSTNQSLNAGSTQTAFVCTAALVASLPLTTDMTTSYLVAFYAQTGSLTLRPQATDKINNGVAGADLVVAVGASLMLITDANGNWWPLFLSGGNGVFSTLSVTGNATIGGALTVTGAALFSSTISVTGASTVNTLRTTGAVTLGGNATAVGALQVGTNVTAGGAGFFGGALSVGSAATVTGAMTIQGALTGQTNASSGNQVPNLSQFGLTTGDPMAGNYPPGTYVKAGNATSGGSGLVTVTFGAAFPTACVAVLATLTGATPVANGWTVGVISKSTTAANFVTGQAGVGTAAMTFSWIAIGY